MLDFLGHPVQLDLPGDSDAVDEALIDCADWGRDARVLLIGCDTLELMCALIRRGCIGVTEARPGSRTPTMSADVALVPWAESVENISDVLAQARHALTPSGVLVLQLSRRARAVLRREIDHALTLHGFSSPRARVLAGQIVLYAGCSLQAALPKEPARRQILCARNRA